MAGAGAVSFNGTASNGTSLCPEVIDDQESDPWSFSPVQAALSASALLALCLASLLANLGVVYYERVVPDTHRTLLNKLAALASAYKACLAATELPMAAARILLGGGLPGAVCRCQAVLFVLNLTQLSLVYNELVVLRYVYVCRLRAVGVIKEELLMRFAAWVNLALGLFSGLAAGMTVQSPHSVYYSFCVDSRETTTCSQGQKCESSRVVPLLWLRIYICNFPLHR